MALRLGLGVRTDDGLPGRQARDFETSGLYMESQWLIIKGYFMSIMVYFGVYWPVILSYLAFQVRPAAWERELRTVWASWT